MSTSQRPEYSRCEGCKEIRICDRVRKPKRERGQTVFVYAWLCVICRYVEVLV